MSIGDSIISCDCGEPFLFTAGERKYYEAHGYHDPVRCPECRHERKIWKEAIGQ